MGKAQADPNVLSGLTSAETALPGPTDVDVQGYDRTNRKLRWAMGIALGGLALLGIVAYGAMVRLRADSAWVAHTHEVLSACDRLLREVSESESNLRAWTLTSQPSFIEAHQQSFAQAGRALDQLRSLTGDNPGQQQRLLLVQQLFSDHAQRAAMAVQVDSAGPAPDSDGVRPAIPQPLPVSAIKKQVGELKAAEEALLVERRRRAGRQSALTEAAIGGGSILAVGLVGLALVSLRRDFAGRQRVERELRESRQDLAVTLHSIDDAVLATDVHGRITRMNRTAEQFTGWRHDEAAGRAVETVVILRHAIRGEPAQPPLAAMTHRGTSAMRRDDLLLVGRDGMERAVSESAAPIRDPQGRTFGLVLVLRDITAQRTAEAQLSAARAELDRERARLSFIFNSVPVGISFALTEPNGRRTRMVNDAHLEICGLRREEFEDPNNFVRITHPDDRAAQENFIRELEAGRINAYSMDKRYVRPDGRTVWVMLSFQRRHFAEGGHEDLSIVVDISDRREAEERTRRQNQHLRQLFESLPGLFLVLTPDFRIVTASDSYLAATMTRREAITGRPLFEVFPDNPELGEESATATLRRSLQRVLATEKPDSMPIQRYDIRRPDGTFEERHWSPINAPLRGDDGRLEYIIHRVEDVTEFVRRKNNAPDGRAEELRARMEQMEAEIFRSTREVQAANDQLRAVNAELESFSYSVSHDLRAPLRHIQGYVAMLMREAEPQLSEKARRYLRTIGDSGREMSQLIDDLLAFSRMGRSEFRATEIDPAVLVDAVRSDLTPSAAPREIEWRIHPLPHVRADPALLRQVWINLLSNAVKYTRGRTPAVIEIGTAGEETGRAIFFVRDNGAGFDMRYATKLFGVFQRLHRTDEFEGTGIGLASVQRILIRHGGRIWAEATVGAGATFYFTLERALPSS